MLRSFINVLTKPKEQVFLAEKASRTASFSKVLMWIVLASIIAGSIKILREAIQGLWVLHGSELDYREHISLLGHVVIAIMDVNLKIHLWRWDTYDIYAELWIRSGLLPSIGYPLMDFIFRGSPGIPYYEQAYTMFRFLLTPVYFLVNLLVVHFLAVMSGGKGKLKHYAYLALLFSVPIITLRQPLYFAPLAIGFVASVLPGVSPMDAQFLYGDMRVILGALISYSSAGYWFFLACLATRVEYKRSWWKVFIIILIASLIGYEMRDMHENLIWGVVRVGDVLEQQPHLRSYLPE